MSKSVLGAGDYVIIGGLLLVSASVGVYFRFSGGRQRTTMEYLMAGKEMGIGPVAFSLMASYMSAISILGIPSEVYMYGTQQILWDFGLPIGLLISMYGLLPIYFDLNVSTSYEYLEKRFGRTTRTIISLVFILDIVLYMTVVVYAPAVAMNSVTEFSIWNIVLSFVAVATFYCYMGGLKAVLWTDVFQSVLMYIPVISITVYVIISKGFTQIYTNAKARGQLEFFNMSFDPTIRYTFWNCTLRGIFSGVAGFGISQIQVQRALSVGSLRKARWAIFGGYLLIFAFEAACVLAGVVMSTIFHDCDPLYDSSAHLSSQDQILPYSLLQKFGNIQGFAGLCLAGILSAALSTISSTLNSLSSVTVEDFIRPYCRCKDLSDACMSWIAKSLAIVYGASCLLLVFMVANFRGVLEASSMFSSFLSGPSLGVYILGFFTATANESGTLIGLFSGVTVAAWISLGAYLEQFPIPTLPRSSDFCPASMNATLSVNGTSEFGITSKMNSTSHNNTEDDRYVFPLYKLSYLWYVIFGTIVTVTVGLVASSIIRCCFKSPSVDVRYLSPFVRRFHLNKLEKSQNSLSQEEIALLNATDRNDEECYTDQAEPSISSKATSFINSERR